PDGLQGMGSRPQTTVGPQSLLLLNNAQVRAAAAAFAKKLAPLTTDAAAATAAYREALGRAPDKDELADALQFLQSQTSAYQEGQFIKLENGARTPRPREPRQPEHADEASALHHELAPAYEGDGKPDPRLRELA